ncbi:serine hydrolase domain-containing protein [Erwinia persicina]|uniref:serine hydrolase domain-containing protein n=1 Tax=Erwinia persicina TaxID=55211 RepID=UPI00177E6940|nr:serine hydrolase [Erwinia persicina]MBD8216334.1 serine hydrolase [Erwinia persicina]
MKKSKAGGVLMVLCAVTAGIAATASAACPVPLTTCPTPLDKTLPDVKNMLTWTPDQRVIGFRNDYRSYPGDIFRAGKPAPLPVARQDLSRVTFTFRGHQYRLTNYLKRNNVTGFMVIKNGKIVWDYYGKGNTKTTLWTSRSVGKSVVSTLVGVALKQGKIASLDDEAGKYNPALRGTAWEHVPLRSLLQHTSGVTWNEDYTDPSSDFARLTQCEAGKDTYACVSKLILDPQRKACARPGQIWSYSSGGAWVLGDTLEKATGETLARYLQDTIWQPYGMVNDGVWHSYLPGKHDVGAHGFNATLEDWGKFGLFVMNKGVLPDGTKTLPDGWIKEATRWTRAQNSVTADYPHGQFGYQWWNSSVPLSTKKASPVDGLTRDKALSAEGIFGQMIAIDQQQKLVIVQWSTWPQAEPAANKQPLEASLMFNAIANALAEKKVK